MRENALEKTTLWIIKLGLWTVPFLPLYVSSSMLFPFITGKNFTFRIIIEIIFALWAGLAIARPEFRPRLTPLFKIATVFITILFLADIFSPNPYRAFFSNYERMEGFMMLFHFYLYFVMLLSVFKTRRDWLVFFHITLITSLIVSYIGLLQKLGYRVSLQGGSRVDSTIGNPTYLAAYLLFHIWMLLLLIYHFWKKWWLVGFYAAAFIFELAILYFTATRGATLALVLVSVPFLAALAVFWPRVTSQVPGQMTPRNSKSNLQNSRGVWGWGRMSVAGLCAVMIIVPLILWQLRDTAFLKQYGALQRITRYSLEETTIRSRFNIWGMSFKGALERPILGWGQENYYLVFQKYFSPGLFAQEPWFDRSHNIIFDWLIHAGFLGLLSYLVMLGAAVWGIIMALKKNTISFFKGLVLLGIFSTYFMQNIFVFDNMNTYLLIFAFLAYTDWLITSPVPTPDLRNNKPVIPRVSRSGGLIAGIVLLMVVLIGIIFFHSKAILESKALINALRLQQAQAPADQILAGFQKALSFGTFGDTEVREQLASLARTMIGNNRVSKEDQKKFVDFTLEELRKETANRAKDIKHLLFMGSILNRAVQLDPSYAAESERVLQEAIALSPGKQLIYFELAQLYLSAGRVDQSIETLRRAWDLDRNYVEAGVNLLTVAILSGKHDVIKETREAFRELDESRDLSDPARHWWQYVGEESILRLANIFQRTGDFASAAEMYGILIQRSPENPQYHASLAAVLAQIGNIEEAKKEVEEAVRLDPSFAAEAETFLKMLDSLKKPK